MHRFRAAILRQCRGGSMRRLLLVGLACCGAAVLGGGAFAATTVYRSVDAAGNVVFTDQPPKAGEAADTIEIKDPASYSTPEQGTAPAESAETWEWDMQADEDADQAPFSYAALAIVAPANDEGVRQNDGIVTVVAAIEPELRPGDQVEVLMDGEFVAAAAGSTITVTEVERGTHTLEVRIVDESGAVVMTSEPSTFHMLRYVPQLAPNRPKPTPKGG